MMFDKRRYDIKISSQIADGCFKRHVSIGKVRKLVTEKIDKGTADEWVFRKVEPLKNGGGTMFKVGLTHTWFGKDLGSKDVEIRVGRNDDNDIRLCSALLEADPIK
jgi:hypothetical protein